MPGPVGSSLVVFLDDLGSVAVFGFEFEGGQEVVAECVVKFPDLLQNLEFGGGVVAVVVDQFAYPGPVFCST